MDNIVIAQHGTRLNEKKTIKMTLEFEDEVTKKDIARFYLDQLFQTLAPITDKEEEYENTMKAIDFVRKYVNRLKSDWESLYK